MQGLADGYFILPYTIGHYLAQVKAGFSDTSHPAFSQTKKDATDRLEKLLSIKGTKSCDVFHRELGYLMLDKVGMSRDKEGLEETLVKIREIRKDFWENVSVPGSADSLNPSLEKANRVADFLEFAEVMVYDALTRDESCGGHFREESQAEDGEAQRKDDVFCHVAAWEYKGEGQEPVRHTEELDFQYVKPSQRSYK
jgi:succinate dehydrogenase / fumarate reductase flavoprotein subunit